MKKLIAILLIVCTLLSFTACDVLYDILTEISEGNVPSDGVTENNGNDNNGDTEDSDGKDTGKKPGGGSKPSEDEGKEEEPEVNKTYTDFTPSEKAILGEYLGVILPFIPNDEYYLEGYYEESDFENGVNYYTVGNTVAEFNEYLKLYSEYELYETYLDDYGDTWYCYVKDDIVIDLSYYIYEGK